MSEAPLQPVANGALPPPDRTFSVSRAMLVGSLRSDSAQLLVRITHLLVMVGDCSAGSVPALLDTWSWIHVHNRVRVLDSKIPGAHGRFDNSRERNLGMDATLAEHDFAQICERRAHRLRSASGDAGQCGLRENSRLTPSHLSRVTATYGAATGPP